jgi:hypothetical protein
MEKRFFVGLILVFLLIGLALCTSYAQEQKADQPKTDAEKKAEEAKVAEAKANEFMGLSFGVALSAALNLDRHPSIDEAEIINGTVCVLKESKAYARVMLESHYFFSIKKGKIGNGPFMAFQPISGNLIGTIAAGWMIGIKKDEPVVTDEKAPKVKNTNNSFNFGLGVFLANDHQELTAGLVEGQKTPQGISVIKFKKKTVVGLCAIFSFSFKI